MKLASAIRRTDATLANVNNALAFLQTQDGVLKTADKVISRMSELAAMGQDVTKSTADLSLYNTELGVLQDQLHLMLNEKFNGISLFESGANLGSASGINTPDYSATMSVVTSHDGDQIVGITQADLEAISFSVGTSNNAQFAMQVDTFDHAVNAVNIVQKAIQFLATLRANNGAEQSRLTFAADMLAVNKTSLESANSRIIDVDVAEESTKLSRFNILQQSGTAMLAQANQSTQSILRLISLS
jgi:flagellin